MLFRTQIIFCSSELRLHFRIAEVGSLLSLNRAWRLPGEHRLHFITFYSRKYYLDARSQGGKGGKMTQCNTI